MENLVYEPDNRAINISMELSEALDAAHERVMRGACCSIRDALQPADGDLVEVTHPMLDINLTEMNVHQAARNLLQQRVKALEARLSEASPLESLQCRVNVSMLIAQYHLIVGDYRQSGFSSSGTEWQRVTTSPR